MTSLGFEFSDGRWGRSLSVSGAWNDDILSTAKSNDVREITFRSYKCFPDDNIEFICELPDLVAISITHGSLDVKPIECLHKLRSIDLGNVSKTPLDFRKFPQLEELYAEWSPAIKGFLEASGLRCLSLDRPPESAIPRIEALSDLIELSLLSCPTESLAPLRHLRNLRELRLAGFRKLTDNGFLSELTELEHLWVQSCAGFSSLEPLRPLKSLIEVTLDNSGPFDSLAPLKDLDRIERFVIMGPRKRVVAKDYSFVENLPNLQHYFR